MAQKRSELNYKLILNVLGFLLVVEGFCMLLGLPFAFYFKEEEPLVLLYAAILTAIPGGALWLLTRSRKRAQITKREGFIIVSSAWIVISFFGTLPFLIGGSISNFTDAFFETMSGFTTTGASILTDIEAVPHSILFWRSMTHWIGGMGIIVLSIAILPFFGIGGLQLYVAEMPGVTKDKLHPRITDTAKRLWGIYILLTFAETAFLMFGGMDFFDGICHSFATMATGGFSTKNTSVAGFTPYEQYVIIVFMVLAGTNFSLHYLALHGKIKEIWRDEEYRNYLYVLITFSVIVSIILITNMAISNERAIRDAVFQVVSIVTTTGFVTSDYLVWPGELWFFIFLLMFIGGMAGSTGGGIKVVRQLLLFKNAGQELKRTIHPNAIIPVRLNNKAISQEIIYKVMAFFQLYVITFTIGAMVMSFLGLDFDSAIGASLATLGNIGPGLGTVGPIGNYAHIPAFGKWFLSFLMMLGRLELFTVLILFSPAFWKR